eukprot:jgi/Mesvir1/9568/Mv25355-RA.1
MRRARARFTALKGFEPGLDILNEREHGGGGTGYRLVADLIYADDTMHPHIARSEHIQTWLDCLGLEARAVGLEISVKTEAMVIGASSRPPLPRLLDGTEVPFRDPASNCRGACMLPDTADDVDIRIGLAWARLCSLNTYNGARRAWASITSACSSRSSSSRCLRMAPIEAWTLTDTLAAKLDGTVYIDAPTGPECLQPGSPSISH